MYLTSFEATSQIGKEITLKGWVNARRDMGKVVFFDLRDRAGIIQVVGVPSELDEGSQVNMKEARPEWVLEIKGVVQERGAKQRNPNMPTGDIEVLAKEIKVLAKAEPLPLDLEDEKMGLDVYLDHLPITLRTAKARALFKTQAEIAEAFRAFMRSKGFTEIQAPKIVGESTEGGANVFTIDYFGTKAFLGQSPQFYKQIMVGVFERVFSVGNVYRAEEHSTSRHINEYTSLDMEMGMIRNHTDIMEIETELLKYIVEHLKKTVPDELKVLNFVEPLLPEKIPALKLREVQEIIKKETGADHTNEPDLEPSEERWICEYVKEKFDSDFIFVTHYPTSKRPMYTYPDETDPEFTKSFDLLFRGIEITTGGQRINDYEQLVGNIKKWGMNPDDFKFYLEAFKYGMPPEGGLGMGLERLTAKLFNIDNVKEATLFPRDLNRIDLQISLPDDKK
ncbi:MAG: Asparagine--tRNA ligase [Parcubacteria group bacterium ADurb.Bin316]|nr:MAG: Asparagine--tRNA ligase [Parcubacteria group bacterium ADurb.Bin316]HOZ56090.1 aspartate--tRNA(Asn) ligase [bacterium]